MEPFPMWIRESHGNMHVNWVAILACTGSLLFSLAIWAGVYSAVEHLAR